MGVHLTLYSRAECHLCDEMKAVVRDVSRDLGLALEEVDVDTDPELRARYDTEVPVLAINGRKAFKYRVRKRDLLRRLDAERG